MERLWPDSVGILAGRYFAAEKLRSICQPGELGDVLLFSQQL